MQHPLEPCPCLAWQNAYNSDGSSGDSTDFTGYHRDSHIPAAHYVYYPSQYAESNSNNSPLGSAGAIPSHYLPPCPVPPHNPPTPLVTDFADMKLEPEYDFMLADTYGNIDGTHFTQQYNERTETVHPGLVYPSPYRAAEQQLYTVYHKEMQSDPHTSGTEMPGSVDIENRILELQAISQAHPDEPLPVNRCEGFLAAVPLPTATTGAGSRGGMKEYVCMFPGCNLRVTRHDHAIAHVATHFKHKPLKCGKCERRFLRQHDRERHYNTCSKRKKSASKSSSGSSRSRSPGLSYAVRVIVPRSCSIFHLVACRRVTWFKSIFR